MHILGHNMAMARALEESEMDTFRHTVRERERKRDRDGDEDEAACERWPRPV